MCVFVQLAHRRPSHSWSNPNLPDHISNDAFPCIPPASLPVPHPSSIFLYYLVILYSLCVVLTSCCVLRSTWAPTLPTPGSPSASPSGWPKHPPHRRAQTPPHRQTDGLSIHKNRGDTGRACTGCVEGCEPHSRPPDRPPVRG